MRRGEVDGVSYSRDGMPILAPLATAIIATLLAKLSKILFVRRKKTYRAFLSNSNAK
jgi:hypothetical protein